MQKDAREGPQTGYWQWARSKGHPLRRQTVKIWSFDRGITRTRNMSVQIITYNEQHVGLTSRQTNEGNRKNN